MITTHGIELVLASRIDAISFTVPNLYLRKDIVGELPTTGNINSDDTVELIGLPTASAQHQRSTEQQTASAWRAASSSITTSTAQNPSGIGIAVFAAKTTQSSKSN